MPLDEMLRGFRGIPSLAFPVIPRAQHCQSLGDPSFQSFFQRQGYVTDSEPQSKSEGPSWVEFVPLRRGSRLPNNR